MPTYDYSCNSCGTTEEHFHSMSDKPEIKCEKCGAVCEKIFSSSGNFVLKGGGWPSTDARFKKNMLEKNSKMKGVMKQRDVAGESVRKISDLAA